MKSHQPFNEQPMSMTQYPMQGAVKFSAKSTKDAKEWLEDLAFREGLPESSPTQIEPAATGWISGSGWLPIVLHT
ncbi:unnamed protein product [Rotaria magnacalcarata]|uniref:Uncharacterized protein n=1 Tax=Rotaria magnacalcarata TaxID=392030 RepID=A0A8S2PQL1_9BILA|nr:unnamed protein product [Rotaria magnacalcarata]